ncbi:MULTISPECIES: hypothetical protein [unclassified Lysinibacillus]|uniref:hypothetical protein n=1 Tax=unclassified Lysinibacillus TaxID=2636778 RepID=UPI00103955C9|nr:MULTISPECIES: hypothetical protein [unclassified Lysinibacillus]MCM0626676.1 hypothetical protein [Lysinibacillus sp. OL1_EC]TBV89158.1 hypothetical protein EW028_06980 [Lysinibacillus sp. OL1]
MIPAEIKIEVNENIIREQLEKRVNEIVDSTLLLIDVKGLAKKLSMSERFIEEEFLHDPRIKLHEVKKNRKRWYFYKPTIEAITEILRTEW